MKKLNLKKEGPQEDDTFEKHAIDLKEAIFHFTRNADKDTLIHALKAVYSDEGQYTVVEWLSECKLADPFDYKNPKGQMTCFNSLTIPCWRGKQILTF